MKRRCQLSESFCITRLDTTAHVRHTSGAVIPLTICALIEYQLGRSLSLAALAQSIPEIILKKEASKTMSIKSSIKSFEPKFMKIGVLTAALQELTPREKRDPDPDLAIEELVAFARGLGADYIQLSAALHPTESDIPAEALLDPVAN